MSNARSPRRSSWRLAGALLGQMALLTACGQEFDPTYRLNTVRVLAVQSEPVAPASGESTTLTPLLYTPPEQRITSMSWSWCPFPGPASEGYPCLLNEDQLAEIGGDGVIPPYDLGEGDTAVLENTLDPALLAAACTGTPEQPALVNCTGGFPIQIKLVARSDDTEVVAVRELRLRFRDEDEPNANPIIDGLSVEIGGGADQTILEDPTVSLPRREDSVIRAEMSPDVAESYAGMDESGEPATERERVIVSWFVESGDLDDERTGYIDGLVDFDDAMENTWKPDDVADYPRNTSEIIVVVRDSRGGVTWKRGTVGLEDAP